MVKQKLLLLHGALGSSAQFGELHEVMNENSETLLFDFSGHGGREIPANGFAIPAFAKEVLEFIQLKNISPVNIFGYSMGGYVALYLARHYPEAVNKIMTLATKFDWNEESSEKEAAFLNPEKIKEKLPAFASQLEKRHSPQDWKLVLNETAEMMLGMGKEPPLKSMDLSMIQQVVLLSVGERDKMVSVEETKSASENLRRGQLLILPDTPHPIEQVDMKMLAQELNFFFGTD